MSEVVTIPLPRESICQIAGYLRSPEFHRDFGTPAASDELMEHDAAQRADIAALRARVEKIERELDRAADRLAGEFGGSDEEWRDILAKEAAPGPARVPPHPRTASRNGPG